MTLTYRQYCQPHCKPFTTILALHLHDKMQPNSQLPTPNPSNKLSIPPQDQLPNSTPSHNINIPFIYPKRHIRPLDKDGLVHIPEGTHKDGIV